MNRKDHRGPVSPTRFDQEPQPPHPPPQLEPQLDPQLEPLEQDEPQLEQLEQEEPQPPPATTSRTCRSRARARARDAFSPKLPRPNLRKGALAWRGVC